MPRWYRWMTICIWIAAVTIVSAVAIQKPEFLRKKSLSTPVDPKRRVQVAMGALKEGTSRRTYHPAQGRFSKNNPPVFTGAGFSMRRR
ncbi:hypothetical protein [Thermogemmata fonticola]|jgi:uncharacterized membrane protein YdfJ with MMPL/SSD domain|uniref:Uncharacterized protein n=1 Tax=Thermogemmata fonticola TaxID=2755323 RepID=A0A7V8VAY4_9BACT|nr:hypothetical protein [Thermogemmata fonticola]MBA2224626.1 hypothetical protein [Thermogemmata fonticola]